MEKKLTGEFQIAEWDEHNFEEHEDGSKQSHAKIKQAYSGDIEGSSSLQYLMAYQTPAEAVFVGHELVKASIDGKSGTFLLQHDGVFKSGVARSEFRIVEGSGKGDFEGISGNGSFTSTTDRKASFELACTF